MAFFIGLNLLVGLFFIGWGDIELYPGPLNLVDEPGRIARDEALWRFLYASFSGTWALLVVAAIAMFFSVLFETPVMATVATLAIYIMLYIISLIQFFEHTRLSFFSTDVYFWRNDFNSEIPWFPFYHYGNICGANIFGLLIAAV